MTDELREVAYTVLTPFTDDATSIDYPAFREHVQWLGDHGAMLYLVCGGSGEYQSLTAGERVGVAEAAVEEVGARATVVAGAGGGLESTKQLLDDYERVGVDAAMIMEPTQPYIHHEGIHEYFLALAEHVDIGLIPYKQTPAFPNWVLGDISEHEKIVGVKFSVADPHALRDAIARCSEDVVFWNGLAERYEPTSALMGTEGYTTGIGNFLPVEVRDLMDALRRQEWERARGISDLLAKYEELRADTGENNSLENANNVSGLKHGLELAGRRGGPVRPPLKALSAADRERADRIYEEIKSAEVFSTA